MSEYSLCQTVRKKLDQSAALSVPEQEHAEGCQRCLLVQDANDFTTRFIQEDLQGYPEAAPQEDDLALQLLRRLLLLIRLLKNDHPPAPNIQKQIRLVAQTILTVREADMQTILDRLPAAAIQLTLGDPEQQKKLATLQQRLKQLEHRP